MLSTIATVLVTVLLCLLGLFLLLKYGLKYWFKRHLGEVLSAAASAGAGSMPIVPRITMVLEKIQFNDPLVRTYMNECKALAYQSAGRYTVPEMPYLQLWCGTHPQDGSFAVIMECENMFVAIDMIRFYEDGSVLGAGTNPFYRPENYPAHMRYMQFALGTPAREVAQWLRDQPVQSPVIQVTHKNLKQLNTRLYAESTDFQLARPTPTFEAFRTRALQDAERVGKPLPTLNEMQWRTGYEQHRHSLLEALDGALKVHLLQGGAISAREWDQVQYDLVFVHARLSEEDAANRALARSAWTPDDPVIERLMGKNLAPVKLFDAIQNALPPEERFSFLASIDKPVPSRVYVPSVESDSRLETQIP